MSGPVADRVGDLMRRMAGERQVIAITHLPQIAGKADTHLLVTKDREAEVVQPDPPDRWRERVRTTAAMLSGRRTTKAATENARELLKGGWRSGANGNFGPNAKRHGNWHPEGKRGIISGALNEQSIAWKVAEEAHAEGATFVLTNAPVAMRMGEIDGLAEATGASIIRRCHQDEDLDALFTGAAELGGPWTSCCTALA